MKTTANIVNAPEVDRCASQGNRSISKNNLFNFGQPEVKSKRYTYGRETGKPEGDREALLSEVISSIYSWRLDPQRVYWRDRRGT